MQNIKEQIQTATTTSELTEIIFDIAERKMTASTLANKSEVISTTSYLNNLEWLAKRRLNEIETNEFSYYKAWRIECKRQLSKEQMDSIREAVIEKCGAFSGKKK